MANSDNSNKGKIDIPRQLNLLSYSDHFLVLGPRQTGKSHWINELLLKRKSWKLDLLDNYLLKKYSLKPETFYSEALFQIQENNVELICIDEVQKVPVLLNEVHRLIETKLSCQFVLTGSSARKLRKNNVNMMGGRAILLNMFPFTFSELSNYSNFDIEKVMQFGLVCGWYFSTPQIAKEKIKSYIDSYIKEEIVQEGLIRSLAPFYRFLDLCGQYSNEIINFANISREAEVSEKVVKSYFEILQDTLIGYFLPSYDVSIKRSLSKHQKFYLFDTGITCGLNDRLTDPLNQIEKGKLFEQFIINEIRAQISYSRSDRKMCFWRTSNGSSEVDLLITRSGKICCAIEIKYTSNITKNHLSSLYVFKEDHPDVPIFVVSNVDNPIAIDNFKIYPWKLFLQKQIYLQ